MKERQGRNPRQEPKAAMKQRPWMNDSAMACSQLLAQLVFLKFFVGLGVLKRWFSWQLLCIPGCPGAHYVDQAGLELKDPPTPAWSAGIQGMNHQLTLAFLYNSGPQAQAGHYSSELGPPQENVPQAWLQDHLMETFFSIEFLSSQKTFTCLQLTRA